jgi:hypothetical protein
MDGMTPAAVPDTMVASLKAREVGGLIELPPPPPIPARDYVRVRRGQLINRVGLFTCAPHKRVGAVDDDGQFAPGRIG